MATSFFNNSFVRLVFKNADTPTQILLQMGFLFTPNMMYTCGTTQTKILDVKDKYLYTNNGYTRFMLIDTADTHYCVNNTMWFWKWDSIEDWTVIQPGEQIKIKCYGYRIPVLGMFPNIYHTERVIKRKE